MEQRTFRDISGTFATGVTVMTSKDKYSNPIGMTANSFTSLSLSPTLVIFNIDKKASLYNHFMETGCFAVNILAADQEYLSRQFSQRDIDRFEGVDYKEDITGAPVLKDVIGYFDCTVKDRLDGGDHIIIIGEVKGGRASAGSPLVFYRGKYIQYEADLIEQ